MDEILEDFYNNEGSLLINIGIEYTTNSTHDLANTTVNIIMILN